MARRKKVAEPKLILQSKTLWIAFIVEILAILEMNLKLFEATLDANVFMLISLVLPVAMIYLRMISNGPVVTRKNIEIDE